MGLIDAGLQQLELVGYSSVPSTGKDCQAMDQVSEDPRKEDDYDHQHTEAREDP
jgi:hypothetical protein